MSDDFDDPEGEVHITIEPREEVLERLGITLEAFEESLAVALDAHVEFVENLDEGDEVPPVEEIPITIGDQVHRLNELADVAVEQFGFDESE